MAQEIERKFLLSERPPFLSECKHTSISQAYLLEADEGEVRVRHKGAEYFLTIKKGSGLTREEYETPITKEQFSLLWPASSGTAVSKTRYYLEEDSLLYEIDEFEGALKGLLLAEVEFVSEQDAHSFEPPSWLGQEVTTDTRYSNRVLAVQGMPE